MESRNHLGVYLRKNAATVVCLAAQGRERKLLDCFSVSVEGEEQTQQQLLADRISEVCAERKVRFTEAAVALDCASFMQHVVHSEFRDPRRIAATVRFDTEEALATDVSDMAVAFRMAGSHDEGANLDVFTAQRAVLSDLLLSFQSNRVDPVTVDPDVCCLSRYLLEYAKTGDPAEHSTLYALLSDSRGYLVVTSGSQEATTLRTFLIGSSQDRNGLLARETLVTAGLAETAHPVGRLCVFDAAEEIVAQTLGERTGLPVSECDLAGMAGAGPDDLADCANAVDFALAYGAALSLAEKNNSVNFRNDHMPYLGKKMRLQKAVRFLSISLTVLLLAIGVYFHSQFLKVNHYRWELRQKFEEEDYLPVMRGKKELPGRMKDAISSLDSALRQIKAEKQGIGATQGSISGRLTLVLKALNDCARQTDLNVESITITPTTIIINGDTSSRQNTVNGVFEAMKKAGLDILNQSANTEGGRDSFTITVEPQKGVQGA